VVGDLSGNLFYHHNTGAGFPYIATMFAGINVGGWSSPFLRDMDRDHDLDLIIGRENGQISYYENTGTSESPEWTENADLFAGISVSSNAVVSLGDVDRNGTLDMITGNSWHELQFFSRENDVWVENTEIVADLVVGQNATPALVDLNADGDLDLAVGNYDGTFNYFENQTVVATDAPVSAPSEMRMAAAYPNPFNPSTTITFELTQPIEISIRIYDLRGNLMTVLQDGFHQEGRFELVWQGLNRRGQIVDAGVYLVVLQSGSQQLTQKVTFLK
jgi:hypothetical protein